MNEGEVMGTASNATAARSLVLKGSGGGGLGDKIWALLVAIMYARLSGRALHVDWRDTAYGDGTLNYFPLLFQLAGLSVQPRLPADGTVWPAVWRDRLGMSLDDVYRADGTPSWNRAWSMRRYSFDMARLDYDAETLVMWEHDQMHKIVSRFVDRFAVYRGLSDEALLGRLWREHLQLVEPVCGRLQQTVASVFAGRPVLGVHVRMTDESSATRRVPSLADYLRATERLLPRMRDGRIFLATDNRAVREPFMERFGAERIVAMEKWFPEAGDPLHMNPTCPDRLRNAQDALLELCVLARCDGLVAYAGSAFGHMAGILSEAPHDCRVAVVPHRSLVSRVRGWLARAFARPRALEQDGGWPI